MVPPCLAALPTVFGPRFLENIVVVYTVMTLPYSTEQTTVVSNEKDKIEEKHHILAGLQ